MNPAAPVTSTRMGGSLVTLAGLLRCVDLAAVPLDPLAVVQRLLCVLAVAERCERRAEVVERVRLVELAGPAQRLERLLRLLRGLLVPAGAEQGRGLGGELGRARAGWRRRRRGGPGGRRPRRGAVRDHPR